MNGNKCIGFTVKIPTCIWVNMILLVSVVANSSESNTNNTYNLNFNNSKTPPSEFPTKNSTKYPILNDPNKLALLTEHTVLERAKIIDKTAKNISKLAETTPEVDPKTQVELIENGEDTEDVRERNRSRSDSHEPGVSLDQGQLAATLAGIFVLIAVIGYIGLLSWRRFLEHRYGNREMLINEEEFNGKSETDFRNFSL